MMRGEHYRPSDLCFRRYVFFITFVLIANLQGCLSLSEDSGHCNITKIRLLAYFPCTSAHPADECDVYAYSAAVLAEDEINDLLAVLRPNLSLELLPVETKNGDPAAAVFHSSKLLLSGVDGVIGPFYPDIASQIVPLVTNHLNAVQITYAVTDQSIDKKGHFYRSLPSDSFLSEARFELLFKFLWLKTGVLSSNEIHYAQSANNFITFYKEWFNEQHGVDYSVTVSREFVDLPDHALREMAAAGLTVILGFFGPRHARTVICSAQIYGLVSPEHVWILPSYSDPYWWRLSDLELESLPPGQNCTNDDMIAYLNSTIFISAIKFPVASGNFMSGALQSKTTELFYNGLLNTTERLFPSLLSSLSIDDLVLHLYSSQASRVYEALWLMASSWIFSLSEGECRLNTEHLESTMFCELCRIYNTCLTSHDEIRRECEFCNKSDRTNNTLVNSVVQDYYGQVLVSQFHGGVHCPVGVYWRNSSDSLEFTRILDNDHCFAGQTFDNNSVTQFKCPGDFWWKGQDHAPDGNFSITPTHISIRGLAFEGVLCFINLCYASLCFIINIVYRKNKHIKASSPRLNIVLILSLIFLVIVNPISDVIFSAQYYNLSQLAGDILCEMSKWIVYLSFTVLFAVVLVKEWRLYRIFHNRKQSTKLKHLSDWTLILLVVLLTLPTIIVLVLWSSIYDYKMIHEITSQSEQFYDRHIINHTLCATIIPNSEVKIAALWEEIALGYNIIILLVIIILSLLNTCAASTDFKRFIEESVTSHKVTFIMIFFLIISHIVIITYTSIHPLKRQNGFWILILVWNGFIATMLTTLFMPKLYAMFRDHRKSVRHTTAAESTLQVQRIQLEEELAKKEEKIRDIKKQRNVPAINSTRDSAIPSCATASQECTKQQQLPDLQSAFNTEGKDSKTVQGISSDKGYGERSCTHNQVSSLECLLDTPEP